MPRFPFFKRRRPSSFTPPRQSFRFHPENVDLLISDLRSPKVLDGLQNTLDQLGDPLDNTTQANHWHFSSWIIDVRTMADHQIALLEKVLEEINHALPHARDHFEQLRQSIPILRNVIEVEDAPKVEISNAKDQLANLASLFKDELQGWLKLVNRLRHRKDRFLTIDAIYYMSRRSGIEVASIAITLLMALGALRISFYYETIGVQISSYWTLEDLVVQGIKFVLPMAILLLLFEIVFRLMRSQVESENKNVVARISQALIRRGPGAPATAFLVIMLVGATIMGHFEGRSRVDGFIANQVRESAMVIENKTLSDVKLVGTTATTATFLIENADSQGEHQDADEGRFRWIQEYWRSLCIHSQEVLPVLPCPCAKTRSYEPLVLDRQHVICHAAIGNCEKAIN